MKSGLCMVELVKLADEVLLKNKLYRNKYISSISILKHGVYVRYCGSYKLTNFVKLREKAVKSRRWLGGVAISIMGVKWPGVLAARHEKCRQYEKREKESRRG